MDIDISKNIESVQDGIKETAEITHEKTHEFHENYVSKAIPELGKYGDAAKFAAELVPGVSEYNAINEGDWKAFAIAAGIDVGAIAVGVVTGGVGYGTLKGGSVTAKTGVKVAMREVAEGGTKAVAGEVTETGTKKIFKEVIEGGAEKAVKETLETGAEKSSKEVIESGVRRATLEVGEAIDKTRFPQYFDEIGKITGREIGSQQMDLLKKALKENEYVKLSPEATKLARNTFGNEKSMLIEMWERKMGESWPRYTEDVVNEAGQIIRKAGQPFDAHHIIELSTGGLNEWWNLHPVSVLDHQNLIHGAESTARKIFG